MVKSALASVPKIKVIAKSDDVLVREYALEPRQAGSAWHRHTEVSDIVYALEGTVDCETLDAETGRLKRPLSISAGSSGEVPAGVAHRLINHTDRPCRYLLIQGVGKYDFS
jgi:uncharacterized cupin superfamily protein